MNVTEQPLPPYGACLLGSINLAMMVRKPFTAEATFDFDRLEHCVATAVRMMDNVVDVSNFPLEQQRLEAQAKRRIGLGVTGVADMLATLGLTYGADDAVAFFKTVMHRFTRAAYLASVELAKEKGAFPLFDVEKYLQGEFIKSLDMDVQDAIRRHGIRNSHLTSIAPTGTISLFANNVSSGIEPVFAYEYARKVTQKDGSKTEEVVRARSAMLYRQVVAQGALPDYFVDAQTLPPLAHLKMQAAAQQYIDSSISKTINLPEDIPFGEFESVYLKAYEMGCKGCTTYRPNEITGSVLSVKKEEKKAEAPAQVPAVVAYPPLAKRDAALSGQTIKLTWPESDHAYYVTINDQVDQASGERRPFEIFINTKNPEHYSWTVALTRMISSIFRRGGDIAFVATELKEGQTQE